MSTSGRPRGRAYGCKKCEWLGEKTWAADHYTKKHCSATEAPFGCAICDVGFPNKLGLEAHKKRGSHKKLQSKNLGKKADLVSGKSLDIDNLFTRHSAETSKALWEQRQKEKTTVSKTEEHKKTIAAKEVKEKKKETTPEIRKRVTKRARSSSSSSSESDKDRSRSRSGRSQSSESNSSSTSNNSSTSNSSSNSDNSTSSGNSKSSKESIISKASQRSEETDRSAKRKRKWARKEFKSKSIISTSESEQDEDKTEKNPETKEDEANKENKQDTKGIEIDNDKQQQTKKAKEDKRKSKDCTKTGDETKSEKTEKKRKIEKDEKEEGRGKDEKEDEKNKKDQTSATDKTQEIEQGKTDHRTVLDLGLLNNEEMDIDKDIHVPNLQDDLSTNQLETDDVSTPDNRTKAVIEETVARMNLQMVETLNEKPSLIATAVMGVTTQMSTTNTNLVRVCNKLDAISDKLEKNTKVQQELHSTKHVGSDIRAEMRALNQHHQQEQTAIYNLGTAIKDLTTAIKTNNAQMNTILTGVTSALTTFGQIMTQFLKQNEDTTGPTKTGDNSAATSTESLPKTTIDREQHNREFEREWERHNRNFTYHYKGLNLDRDRQRRDDRQRDRDYERRK